jgi:archaellum component FlaF (FlaF/FlaG flagellin family)
MDKVIVTVLLIIGGVVSSFAIFNGVFPALERSSSAINSATNQINDQIKSQIEIINVSSDESTVQFWVKNTGTSVIGSIENSDVFITDGTTVEHLVYGEGLTPPSYWNYQLVGDSTTWRPTVTIEVAVYLSLPLTPGSYQIKFVIPNGISDEADFGE